MERPVESDNETYKALMKTQTQNIVTIQDIDPEIKSMFIPGEEVLLIASQARAKPGGSLSTPNKIYVTNM
jgi:hypothetical protein